ncbi:hypothetical protein AB0D59_47515 [Streptomyces sp. NPDC048417]|uniref:hypothetical protein n=1 Tax=Streptomyces sp. NPDC048417 TaxID=3155387 RepID=UPI0034192D2B
MFRLFTRNRSTIAEPSAPEPEPWPENWAPDGVMVAERYHNQVLAVVLVYTTDANGSSCAVACLGCHYQTMSNGRSAYRSLYSLADAAKVANEHASTCRALARPLLPRPDDNDARDLLHKWVHGSRSRKEDVTFHLCDFDLGRLTLQRTRTWIETELELLAAAEPDVLHASRCEYSGALVLHILRHPDDRS